MILDRIENSKLYLPVHPGLKAAFEFLRRPDLDTLTPGRHEIDGARLYVMVNVGDGKGRGGAKLEAHRKYIDVQYTLSGAEVIGWKNTSRCQKSEGYDPARDLEFFADAAEVFAETPAGAFMILFPEDAHAPMSGTGALRKLVVKVALEW